MNGLSRSGTGGEDGMEAWHVVWVLAAVTGLVSAGLVGSAWAVASGERPNLAMLGALGLATPLKWLVLLFYGPLAVTRFGIVSIDYHPVSAIVLLFIGVVWSFLQGVFILTTFFGFT
jgi:hypothetical protein